MVAVSDYNSRMDILGHGRLGRQGSVLLDMDDFREGGAVE
jgi:hypothetical protein